jgi:hypothetical protein
MHSNRLCLYIEVERMRHEKLIVILLITSLIINIYWGWYFYPIWFPHNVNIPNQRMINNFCKEMGFDSGWLSSTSCEINQVQCEKHIFDMIKYQCIEWR